MGVSHNSQARTGDGAISLTLPADANARIETDSERVINDINAVAEEAETETPERRVRNWRVGSGAGSRITLSTGDGQIFLRRQAQIVSLVSERGKIGLFCDFRRNISMAANVYQSECPRYGIVYLCVE
jgi:hypothetical protein